MKNATIHFTYIIAILIAIISILLWRLPNGNSLSAYIAFAASIASLILAVVAIFQSIISSDAFGKAIFQIQTSAEKIVEETSRLGKASLSLGEEAESALRRLSEIPEQIQSLKGEISDKFEKIIPKSSSEDGQLFIANDVIGGKTYAFAISIYIISLSHLKNKYVVMDDLFESEDLSYIRQYATGVISTMKYFNVCGADIEGIRDSFHVKSFGKN